MPIKTPVCDFGKKAENFELKSTENKLISLNDIKGENGTLVMFICNHCPYVKANNCFYIRTMITNKHYQSSIFTFDII